MRVEKFYESQLFRLTLLILLSFALIEIIFVGAGFVINKYFFNIISVLDCVSLANMLIVFIFFAIEKFAHVEAQLNKALLRLTLLVTLVSSLLIIVFANKT